MCIMCVCVYVCVCTCVHVTYVYCSFTIDLPFALLSLYLASALRADAMCLILEFFLHDFLLKICLLMYCSTLCSSIYSEIRPSATSSSTVSNDPSPKEEIRYDMINLIEDQ